MPVNVRSSISSAFHPSWSCHWPIHRLVLTASVALVALSSAMR